MSHGTHIPSTPPEQHDNKNYESFGAWAAGQVPFVITQVISISLALSTFVYYVTHGEEKLAELANFKLIEKILFSLNLAFCIFCVIKLQAIYLENSNGEYNALRLYNHTFDTDLSSVEHNRRRKQSAYLLQRFKFYFFCFWIILATLYAVFTVQIFSQPGEKSVAGSLVKEQKTIVSTYLSSEKNEKGKIEYIAAQTEKKVTLNYGDSSDLSHIAEGDTTALRVYDFHGWLEALRAKWDSMLTYSLNTISIMFILWCFSIMAVRAQHPSLLRKPPTIIRLSPFLTFLLVALYPGCLALAAHNGIYYEEILNNYSALFEALSGVINAVVYALFIARLDSKFVSLPSNLIGLLYLYAAVQPLFLVFDSPGVINATIKVCVLLMVFILKIYFFFIITYAMQEGKIFAYLYCFSTLNQRVEAYTKNQYTIRPHPHNDHIICSIFFKKSELFMVHGSWHERSECLQFIDKLRVVAKDPYNYHLEEIADDRYVVIRNKDGIEYFISAKPVSSKQKFLEMREDACWKIPYCNIDLSQVH